MKKTLQKGFTLIELLVVIAIIAILAAITITSLAPAQRKAKLVAFQAEVRSAAAGFVIMCDDLSILKINANYPEDSSNIEWSALDQSADIDDSGCGDQLGEFKISNISPRATSIAECATITNGNVSFTGAAC